MEKNPDTIGKSWSVQQRINKEIWLKIFLMAENEMAVGIYWGQVLYISLLLGQLN